MFNLQRFNIGTDKTARIAYPEHQHAISNSKTSHRRIRSVSATLNAKTQIAVQPTIERRTSGILQGQTIENTTTSVTYDGRTTVGASGILTATANATFNSSTIDSASTSTSNTYKAFNVAGFNRGTIEDAGVPAYGAAKIVGIRIEYSSMTMAANAGQDVSYIRNRLGVDTSTVGSAMSTVPSKIHHAAATNGASSTIKSPWIKVEFSKLLHDYSGTKSQFNIRAFNSPTFEPMSEGTLAGESFAERRNSAILSATATTTTAYLRERHLDATVDAAALSQSSNLRVRTADIMADAITTSYGIGNYIADGRSTINSSTVQTSSEVRVRTNSALLASTTTSTNVDLLVIRHTSGTLMAQGTNTATYLRERRYSGIMNAAAIATTYPSAIYSMKIQKHYHYTDAQTFRAFNMTGFNNATIVAHGPDIVAEVSAMGNYVTHGDSHMDAQSNSTVSYLRYRWHSSEQHASGSTSAEWIRERWKELTTHPGTSTTYGKPLPVLSEVVNLPSRVFYPKLEVYFDGEAMAPTVFDKEEIVDFSLLEEMKAESKNPLGAVSSNEFTFSLNNEDNQFTPTNTASPYYGKMEPKVKVVASLGCELQPGYVAYVELGTFFINDWKAVHGSMEAQVLAYDSLYYELGKPLENLRVIHNTTLQQLFDLTFQLAGIANYSIDVDLNVPVGVGWLPNGSFGQVLQALAEAARCVVFVDRNNTIRVKRLDLTGSATRHLTDDNQIITATLPVQYRNLYPTLNVNVYKPELGKIEEVGRIEKFDVPVGGTILEDYMFNKAPVAKIHRIDAIGAEQASVKEYRNSAWDAVIEFENGSTVADVVDINIQGRAIENSKTKKTKTDTALKDLVGDRVLDIDNHLIQDDAYADAYLTDLFNLVSKPELDIALDIRGNPQLGPGQPINISDAQASLSKQKAMIVRSELFYDGGLTGKMACLKIS